MRNGKKSLDSWIGEALQDTDKEGKCSMMSLVHMVGQQPKEIHTTKFGAGKSWNEVELATMFRGKATTYCQDLPGVQTFQLLAFYGAKTAPEAFMPFVVNVNSNEAFGGLGTESPTEQGMRAQDMRQREMMFQQVYRRQQIMDDYTLRLIEQQGRTIESVSRENREAYEIVKEVLMEKALNEHNRKMDQLKFERDTGERRKWMAWAPPLINTILGREIFPQSTADTALVESIAESLSEDDIMKLAGAIKPELMGPLAARMGSYMQKKQIEDQQLKQLSQLTSPDPESDAAGDVVQIPQVSANGKA